MLCAALVKMLQDLMGVLSYAPSDECFAMMGGVCSASFVLRCTLHCGSPDAAGPDGYAAAMRRVACCSVRCSRAVCRGVLSVIATRCPSQEGEAPPGCAPPLPSCAM